MCILCDTHSLRLLAAPLETLSNPDLAEAIRAAREAAMQLVLDTADAWADDEEGEDAFPRVDPDSYLGYVVERAEHDGLLTAEEARDWRDSLRAETLLSDPRVQAFLSSAAEGLAVYITQIREKRALLERYLEVRRGTPVFGGIGPAGEIYFDYGEHRYVVLSDDEAMQIAMEHVTNTLWQEDPARLLRYSSLPDDGIGILTAAQQGPQDRANDILAGIVDVALLTEDTVRQHGYARFVAEGPVDDVTEQRFGDVVILCMRLPDEPAEDD